jgi:hypothetical protein
MKRVAGVLVALALAATAAAAGPVSPVQPACMMQPACAVQPCCPPCVEQPCTVDKLCLKADVKITPCIKKKPIYVVEKKEEEKEVPCTVMVPVCVTDPCTGCQSTVEQPKTVVKKVRYLCFEVKCDEAEENKPEICATIIVDHKQVPAPPPPPPCCPCPGHCPTMIGH